MSLLVGFAVVLATLGGGAAGAPVGADADWASCKDAPSRLEAMSLDVPEVSVWATAEDTLGRPSHRHLEHHPYGEGVETERELDDDSERIERIAILIALAARFAPAIELPPSDPDVAPRRTTHLSSVRTSRGPPRA